MITLIFGVIVALISIVFALQNSFPVTVKFFSGQYELSLALLMLISFSAGVLISSLLIAPKLIKAAWQNWKVKRL